MNIILKPYPDVQRRCSELDLKFPDTIAIVPRNFLEASNKHSLLEEGTSVHVRRIWEQIGISETPFAQEGDVFWAVTEKDTDWVGPTLFIAGSFYSQNPHLISISLNLISEYVMGLFQRTEGSRKSRLSVIVDRTNTLNEEKEYIQINYEGQPEGIRELAQTIHEILHRDRK